MNVPVLRFPEFDGEWAKFPLKQYARMQGGFAFKSEDFSTDGVAVVRISNISAKSGVVDLTSAVKHPQISRDENFRINKGDILIALSGATTGKACIYNLDDTAYLNQRVGLLQKSSEKLHYNYLVTLIFSELFSKQLLATLVAGAQPNVSPKDIEKFEFGFPSLPEQKKIAAFLGVVDAKIAALRARRAGLERYKRGLMQALFSQTLRFTKPDGTAFPDWEEKRLGDFLIEHRGGAPLTPSDFVERSAFEVIPKKAIGPGGQLNIAKEGTFTTSAFFQSYLSSTIDSSFLVTTLRDLVPSGPSIGCIVEFSCDQSYLLAQGVYGFKIEESRLNRKFLIAFSNTVPFRRRMQRLMVGSTQVHIRNADFFQQSLTVPCPNEQQKIADALSAMDAKIAAVGDQVTQMEAFKKGLLQQMFV